MYKVGSIIWEVQAYISFKMVQQISPAFKNMILGAN